MYVCISYRGIVILHTTLVFFVALRLRVGCKHSYNMGYCSIYDNDEEYDLYYVRVYFINVDSNKNKNKNVAPYIRNATIRTGTSIRSCFVGSISIVFFVLFLFMFFTFRGLDFLLPHLDFWLLLLLTFLTLHIDWRMAKEERESSRQSL